MDHPFGRGKYPLSLTLEPARFSLTSRGPKCWLLYRLLASSVKNVKYNVPASILETRLVSLLLRHERAFVFPESFFEPRE